MLFKIQKFREKSTVIVIKAPEMDETLGSWNSI